MSASRPVSYTIDGDGIHLDIALVEIDELLLHEETISGSFYAFMEEIERSGILKSPVIVGRESLVVLDGTHRVEALRNLGCRFMCVCLVDYMSPGIRVDR
ncbi:ParB N-terminal domain-containing protein [Candidatus Bathyarchaeota archaeon]|nr:ParB N-terminal domain-containing protein [Candidatus Bathyarchaeota archaeon]